MRRTRSFRRTRSLAAAAGPTNNYSLEKSIFSQRVPRLQNQRQHFSKFTTLDTIDEAIRQSAAGMMVKITDLGAETLSLDGHLSSLVQKRFNRVSVFDHLIKADDPANWASGWDLGLAEERADFCRRQLVRIPNFRARLKDLEWGVWNNRALLEIDWEVVPGREVGDSKLTNAWRVRDLHWVHPRRLSYTQNRHLCVIDDERGSDFRPVGFLPSSIPEKFIQFTPRLFNDYAEREGLMPRSLYWSFFQRLGTKERIALMEIFGAPWRLAYSEGDRAPNVDAVDEAWELLQGMNSRVAAWLPHGVRAMFVQPNPGSSATHKEVIDDARYVLSKMILGSTGTTDAVTTGLGSSIGDAHLSEEDLIVASDLIMLADVLEHQLTDRIIAMNYGLEGLMYAPIFGFNIEALVDRTKEIGNLEGATKAGLRIPLEQAYSRAGYRAPRPGEPYIAWVDAPTIAGMPTGEAGPRIVYPVGKAPPPGELSIPPEESLGNAQVKPAEPPVSSTPPSPSAPPSAAPEAPARDAPKPEQEPVAQASEEDEEQGGGAIKLPFASPSGLSDEEREDPIES